MEKVIYCIERATDQDIAGFSEQLRDDVTSRLIEAGAHGVQVNIADDDVAPAAGYRITSSTGLPDAIVSVWLDTAIGRFREPIDDALAPVSRTMAAYLVTESVPIPNVRFPVEPGERTRGMAQIAFLQRPTGQSTEEWLGIWLDSHTQIAIETQDTFLYVQNVVTRVLSEGSTPWHAIVEEGFPSAAMTDPHVFFDAVGDDERLARNQEVMFESVQRFIDLSKIDVVPTSRYVMRSISGADPSP